MAQAQTSRFLTLLQREFREYRNSMFWAPVIAALLLGVLMIASVVLVNRVSFIGDAVLEALLREGGSGVNISISVNEDNGGADTVVRVFDDGIAVDALERADSSIHPGDFTPPPPAPPGEYEVTIEDTPEGEEWNFSREWTFNPADPVDDVDGEIEGEGNLELDGRELNAILSAVHWILLLILLGTSANYLLGTLYDDRKDRSILFWRSMPVNETQIVLSKFVMAILLTPLIYVAISLLLQLAYVLLMMVLVWRMDQDPFSVVVANIDFVALMLDPISGWLLTALLIAPTYAWLLFASALAKRSPFMTAAVPMVGLVIIEGLLFRSEHIGDAITRHFPHVSDMSAVGFYLFGPDWTDLNLMSVGAGLAFAAAALAGAIWLRQHRWELN